VPRKPIADMIEDIEAPAEEPELPAPPPAHPASPEPPGEAPPAAPAAARPRASRSGRPRQAKPGRPSARDLAAPAKQALPREALKVDVPAELALLQRLHRRRLDTGIDLRDQVAIAVDEYLTSEGY
jgi:hypothetical protein